MAKDTTIPWCTATWNPWIGCADEEGQPGGVSEGCRNCYARTWAKRTGTSFEIHRASRNTFMAPTRWPDPEVVFPCSLSDFLHSGADEWREEAWHIIRHTQHTYLILTKRPERFEEVLAKVDGWPLPNVWLGVTVENQAAAHFRIPWLFRGLAAKAVGHFLSMEPLLEQVDVGPWLGRGLSWIITGGESGPKARSMDHRWVWHIVDDCNDYEVPVFVKQLSQAEGPGFKDPNTWPAALRVQETPEALRCSE